jgi:hypothetical protein
LALLAIGVGCNFNEDFAEASDYKIDKKALDIYMSDAPVPTKPVSFDQAPQSNTENKGIYGHWVAQLDMGAEMDKEKAKRGAPKNEEERMAQEMGDAFAEAMGSMMSFDLTINEDKTFTLVMMFFPIEGHWVQNGDRIVLTPEKVMGMSAEDFAKQEGASSSMNSEPLELQILPNGGGLKAIDPKGELGQEELLFKRPN